MIDLVKTLDEQTEKNIRQSGHRATNRASEAGWVDDCLRYLVLSRLHPELKERVDISLQRIFDEGRRQEFLLRREIEDAGLRIVKVDWPLKWKKFNLTGHIDGRIVTSDGEIAIELKSCSPNVFRVISTYQTSADLLSSKYIWVRHYPAQVMLYLIMADEEKGIILFKDKSTGKKHQINTVLDYDYTERILKGLEQVNRMVDENDPPPPKRVEACKRCPFARTACFVGQDFGPGFDLMEDAEIEAKLDRWMELWPKKNEFEELDKEIKEAFRGKNVIIGDYKIESKEYERKNYKVPKEVKDQYVEISTYFRTSIEKI